MLDIRKQAIGDISNSNVVAINGDVTIDGKEYNDLLQTLIEIVRKDFESFSSVAINSTKEEITKYLKSIFENLVKDNSTQLTKKFQNPATQVILHDSLISYVSTEDETVKECIVDLMIEQLKAQNGTTEQSIINEAIKLIPNLNINTLSLLALMSLRHQMLHPSMSFMLESAFEELSPIINQAPQISNLDIDFILQNKCTRMIAGLYPIDTLENHFIKQYDLFFRDGGNKDDLDAYAALHPEIMQSVDDMGCCMFCFTNERMDYWKFCDINSKLFFERLRARRQQYLIPLVEELLTQTRPFTQNEVRKYFCKLNPNWLAVFNLLDSKQLICIGLSMLGMYIGSKYIAKVTKKPSLPISSFVNPIILEK
jgi:hypothetical protein